MTSLLSSVAHQEFLVDEGVHAETTLVDREKRNRVLRWLVLAFLVNAALTALAVVTWLGYADETWHPLGPYEEQQATSTVVVPADGRAFIDVAALKCADETVTVSGVITWLSTEPAGAVVSTTAGVASVRDKGCKEWLFRNQIPADVISATAGYGGTARWRITGVETPIDAARIGVPEPWWTNEFTLIVEPPPI